MCPAGTPAAGGACRAGRGIGRAGTAGADRIAGRRDRAIGARWPTAALTPIMLRFRDRCPGCATGRGRRAAVFLLVSRMVRPRCRTTAEGPMRMNLPSEPTRWEFWSSSSKRPSLRETSSTSSVTGPGSSRLPLPPRAGLPPMGTPAAPRRSRIGHGHAGALDVVFAAAPASHRCRRQARRRRYCPPAQPAAPGLCAPGRIRAPPGPGRASGECRPRACSRRSRPVHASRCVGRGIALGDDAEGDAGIVHIGEGRSRRRCSTAQMRRDLLFHPAGGVFQRAHRTVAGAGAGGRPARSASPAAHAWA